MRTAPVLALGLCLAVSPACHTPPPITQVTETTNWRPDSSHADELSSEETAGNGIEVGAPKIYDDASLRLMLDATRATLATMTGLNQGALTASLGSLNGATISQTQFGLQISGPASLPTTGTTLTGPTTTTTTNDSAGDECESSGLLHGHHDPHRILNDHQYPHGDDHSRGA
jgi:hypothetical protein